MGGNRRGGERVGKSGKGEESGRGRGRGSRGGGGGGGGGGRERGDGWTRVDKRMKREMSGGEWGTRRVR